MSKRLDSSHTVVRRLTAAAASAIAAIAIDGPMALPILSEALVTATGKRLQLNSACARFAHWRFSDSCLSDEHVIVLVRGPQSVEIHCHGGLAITSRIIEQLQATGCVAINATAEVSGLAYDDRQCATDELDSHVSKNAIQAAALLALQNATTLKASVLWLEQYQGALFKDIEDLDCLMQANNSTAAIALCDALLQRGKFGLKVQQPWRLTLAGPPNVGKSSLMNALCGAARVLVHHEPGTTRDAIETNLVIGDWPLVLTDTAGIRDASETIERLGIETAWQRWLNADLGLLVVDATVGWTEQHAELLAGPQSIMIVLNKVDATNDTQELKRTIDTFVAERLEGSIDIIQASAKSDAGIEMLVETIARYLDNCRPVAGSGVPFTPEQIKWIEQQQSKLSRWR